MQKIHVIGHSGCFTRHLHPIRVFQSEILDMGMDVKYFPGLRFSGIQDCDCLVIFEANYRDLLPISHKDRFSSIEYLIKFFKIDNVIWFDDHDSSLGC